MVFTESPAVGSAYILPSFAAYRQAKLLGFICYGLFIFVVSIYHW